MDRKEWLSLLPGLKWMLGLIVLLGVVGMMIPSSPREAPGPETVFRQDTPEGIAFTQFNRDLVERHGQGVRMVVPVGPSEGHRSLVLSETGHEIADRAMQSPFYAALSSRRGGAAFLPMGAVSGVSFCALWQGGQGQSIDRLTDLLMSSMRDSSSVNKSHQFVALHELGHCLLPTNLLREFDLSDRDLKGMVREIIEVDDEILSHFFVDRSTGESGSTDTNLFRRYLSELLADSYAIQHKVHEIGYDIDDVLKSFVRQVGARLSPNLIEYGTLYGAMLLIDYQRDLGRTLAREDYIDLVRKSVRSDRSLSLNQMIVGVIAERHPGEYRVVDQDAYENSKAHIAWIRKFQ